MIAPEFTATFNDRRVTLALEELPRALRVRLRGRITSLTRRLLALVHAVEPQVTGALRRQTRAFVDERENFIRGRVRILGTPRQAHNVAAAALEYGAHRQHAVRAHRMRLTHVFGRAVPGRQMVMVRAHRRRPNIAARRFLRGPAATIRPRALAELQGAVSEAIADAKRRR